jgi:hypothetical protein
VLRRSLLRSLLVPLSVLVFSGATLGDAEPNDSGHRPMLPLPEIRLPKGTTMKVRVMQPISSDTAKLGDQVDLEVAEDVKVDGTVIVSKGGKAEGFVTQAMSGKLWGAGSVTVHVGSVVTRTGFRLPVYGSATASAISGVLTDNAAKEATIRQGVEITVSTEIDIPLEAAFYRETELTADK